MSVYKINTRQTTQFIELYGMLMENKFRNLLGRKCEENACSTITQANNEKDCLDYLLSIYSSSSHSL